MMNERHIGGLLPQVICYLISHFNTSVKWEMFFRWLTLSFYRLSCIYIDLQPPISVFDFTLSSISYQMVQAEYQDKYF
jgi:hypothetical protein